MIYLQRSTNNIFAIHASDLIDLETPIYLFRFVNEQTTKENLIELDKENPGNTRFDSFTLDLPNDLDLDAGKYHVFVYESDTTGKTDFENMQELTNFKVEIPAEEKEQNIYEPEETTDTVYSPNS